MKKKAKLLCFVELSLLNTITHGRSVIFLFSSFYIKFKFYNKTLLYYIQKQVKQS